MSRSSSLEIAVRQSGWVADTQVLGASRVSNYYSEPLKKFARHRDLEISLFRSGAMGDGSGVTGHWLERKFSVHWLFIKHKAVAHALYGALY